MLIAKKICPQCQGKLTEVLDSDGQAFICTSDFHGKISPQFSLETLEIAQGIIFIPSQPLPDPTSVCLICSSPAVRSNGYCSNCDNL